MVEGGKDESRMLWLFDGACFPAALFYRRKQLFASVAELSRSRSLQKLLYNEQESDLLMQWSTQH